jgi:uncharacterized protein (TIGR02302 family)
MVDSRAGLEQHVTGRPSASPSEPRRRIDPHFAEALLSRALTRAWWAVLWERLWPPVATLATAVGAFLIVSWAGLWLVLPPIWRAVGVLLFGLLVMASAVPLARLALPRRQDTLRRLDLGSGLPHRPATTISDKVADGTEDKGSLALWQAHMVRAVAAAERLKAGVPQPRLLLRDPYAVRGLVLILAIATFIGAGSDRTRRITAAFDWQGVVQAANFRIDAWVTPPTYTGKPPVILPGVTDSVLVIRATGTRLDLATTGLVEGGQDASASRAPAGTEERRFTVTEDASVTLRGVGNNPTWSFTAIPDRAPTIALAKDPEPQSRGSLQLAYKVEDDYGVTFAEAQFALKSAPRPETKAARPLYGPPNFPLALPQARTRNGVGQTIKDLSEHPWSGVDVAVTLMARDEANNEGHSAAHEFKLPQRPFYKPVPKALVEQRRILALDAEARGRVLKAIDALTIAPERFTPEAGVYVGLRAVYWLLVNAKSDDDLRDVVNRLWAMAVQIEDGNISDAEAALRAAQEALRQALERGASEEEIKRLMDQLRAALDKFLQALAEELRKNPQQLARPLDRNVRELRPQDLKSMLDRLENLARSGNKDAARQLLEQLQQMLENLQMARPGQQGDMDDDMMSALDELGDMIRREQQLRDRTFRQGQDSRRERQQQQRGQRGQRGQQSEQGDQQGQQGFDELRQGQQALREQLKKLLEELRKRGQMGQMGKQPGQQGDDEGADALGRAEQAMRDAEGQLGEGDADGAVDSQGKAIDAMRKGAQGLAQQMGPDGPGGPGPNGRPGRMGQSRANQDTDPLGRPLRGRDLDDGLTVKVPGEIDVQRARRILEELRRRFADPLRPQLELDYIERLLKDF